MLFLLLAGPAHAGDGETGISYDEYRRNVPPAPLRLRVEICGGTAMLFWELPDVAGASEKLAYDPVISGYRVYRIGPGGQETLVGETKGSFYRLALPPAGRVDYYAATAVQRSGHESALSGDVAVGVP